MSRIVNFKLFIFKIGQKYSNYMSDNEAVK